MTTPLPPVAYDPSTPIQEYMLEWVRDLLGVDETTLPDAVMLGLPAWRTWQAASRQLPSWSTLTQNQRVDFDEGVCYELAANCVQRLRTLYADGEGTADMRAGRYDWLQREPDLRADARAAFDRALGAVTGLGPSGPVLLVRSGRSRSDGFTSPDLFKYPAGGSRPFPWIPTVVPE